MANPTTNYGWPMPTATDLVTDLPADFAAFGQPVDTSLKALNPETTLGDIAYRSSTANTNTRLGIGSTGQVLTVAAGVPSWATPAGASGPAFAARAAAPQSLTQSVTTKVLFGTEDFDTASDFASSRFTPTTAGYYQINTTVIASTNNAGYMTFYIYKNGAVTTRIDVVSGVTTYGGGGGIVIAMNGTTDYLEVYATLDGSGNPRIDDGSGQTVFSGIWIRGL